MTVIARPNERDENRLLASLPNDEYERLRPRLEHLSFSLGEVVYEFGGHLEYVFFPTTSIVSLLYTMENGTSAEMGLTGNDGVVGIALFMGGGTMPNRAVVQSAGDALRMTAKVLQDEFARGGKFQHLLLRYTQALITQISRGLYQVILPTFRQKIKEHEFVFEFPWRGVVGKAPLKGVAGHRAPVSF